MMPSINKIAHEVVPKISSVKDAFEKIASTYAFAAAFETTKLSTIMTISKPRDISSILLVENAGPFYKKKCRHQTKLH